MATAVRCINDDAAAFSGFADTAAERSGAVDTFALEQMARLVEARLADFVLKPMSSITLRGRLSLALNLPGTGRKSGAHF